MNVAYAQTVLDVASKKIVDKLFTTGRLFKRRKNEIDIRDILPEFGYYGKTAHNIIQKNLNKDYQISASKNDIVYKLKIASNGPPRKTGYGLHWSRQLNRSTVEWGLVRPVMHEFLEKGGIDPYQSVNGSRWI